MEVIIPTAIQPKTIIMKKATFLITAVVLLLFGCKKESKPEKEASKSEFAGTKISELVSSNEKQFPSYNTNFPPPAGAPEVFQLSQDYPHEIIKENFPWLSVDFKKSPDAYIRSVLKYSLEGNIEVGFKGQLNKVRKWYHAPWLHDDGKYDTITGNYIGNGREYIHGLTRERPTPKFEIHTLQDVTLENWAVGMYNAPGGYTLGSVWDSPTIPPHPEKANFPEGTVCCKLLFTDGTVEKVPFLKGTLEWQADIYPCNPSGQSCQKRSVKTVRLLQIDIAVKDRRASETGWVFGTFIYDASNKGITVWDRMVPVGLSWGNDPKVTNDLHKDGAFINKDLKESYINASLIEVPGKKYTNQAYMRYHGLGGRLNGPVDNPISSCVSCHGQAGVSSQGHPMPMGDFSATRQNYPIASFELYFTNPKPGAYNRTFQNNIYMTTDYSLQLESGIRNYFNNNLLKKQVVASAKAKNKDIRSMTETEVRKSAQKVKSIPEVTRGGE